MELLYNFKLSEADILLKSNGHKLLKTSKNEGLKNKLIEGENIRALHELVNDKNVCGKVDLIYIDPPFATKSIFTINGDRSATVSKSNDGLIAYSDTLTGIEFIEFLRERLILLKMLLSDKGSIYLHIDYKIGHYVKIMMDEVFGIENFRNDITRIKCNPKNFARKGYSNIKDMILFYSKSDKMIWNEPKSAYSEDDIVRLFPKKNKDGRRYTTVPIHAPGETKNGESSKMFKGMPPPIGRHWRSSVKELDELDAKGLIEWSSTGNPRMIIFADERDGKRMQDIWEFKDPQYPVYPTEKNANMLDLIMRTSSNEDSLILDCFCGSGTTILSAIKNKRNWIGIDKSTEAIKATLKKISTPQQDLFNKYNEFEHYKVVKL